MDVLKSGPSRSEWAGGALYLREYDSSMRNAGGRTSPRPRIERGKRCTKPAEKVRFINKSLVTGRRDECGIVWAI